MKALDAELFWNYLEPWLSRPGLCASVILAKVVLI